MRKHGWIRAEKLNYQDNISNKDLAITELQKTGFLNTTVMDLKDALNLLSKGELKEISKEKNLTLSENNPVRNLYVTIYFNINSS